MFITVNGLSVGLELNREDLEVEHHTFLDEGVYVCVCVCARARVRVHIRTDIHAYIAWGTSVRPCVMPVDWNMAGKHQTPIVLGAVFFRSYNVLFDLSASSPTVPPTLGLAKINPGYDIIGVSDYAVHVTGGDGGAVQRVFVQHTPAKIISNGPDEVGVANPNGHQVNPTPSNTRSTLNPKP